MRISDWSSDVCSSDLVDLDDRRLLRPVVDAVARQRREGIEPRAQRQHHVSPRDQLHGGLGAVVAERAGKERMRAGEGVVVLVARSEEHTSELQSLMRISSAVFCLKKNTY